MGTKLSDKVGTFNPTAVLKTKDAMLKGILNSVREIKTQYGPRSVYVFKVLDATCRFSLDKADVEPEKGQLVDVIPPSRLAIQLKQAHIGDTLTIKYLGLGEGGKGRNKPHVFDVEKE